MASFIGPSSIIQSNFVSDGSHGNLEGVLFVGGKIRHYYGVPGANGVAWSPAQILPSPATGPASLIQSDFGDGKHGNFEVVVPEADGLWHWWHDNSDVTLPWKRGGLVSPGATGPGSIIQSSIGTGKHGNFEVVVLEADGLWHWWHDNSDVTLPWKRGGLVSSAATGPGCIIQSTFGSPGNFEVVVLEGNQLWHHWHDNSNANSPWQRGGLISSNATGPGSIIQGQLGSPPNYNFEVVVLEGNNLVHYWHDNSDVNSPWQRGQVVSVAATGPGSIVRSDYGPGGPGNFEVLAQELTQSVVHYWHHNVDATLPWWRGFRILIEDQLNSPDLTSMVKIAQLTGDYDRQWKVNTLSMTASRYGVVGTDLGSSFEHAGRIYFLFGDTTTDLKIRTDNNNLDTIAYTTATPDALVLVCNPSYPKVDNIDQSTFCVPCDGISVPPPAPTNSNPRMYVYFTTDPIPDPGTKSISMGRCVLARSDDNGNNFGSSLFDLSRDKFINLSLQVVDCRSLAGLPQRFGQGVLIWATGGYRRSNAYLGFVPLASIEDRSAYVFYAGITPASDLPVWVADEAQAASLFLSGCMGELCVRWNPQIGQFVMLYNSDNPGWILARQSSTPWGPWSDAQNIFNPNGAWGYGGYMHQPGLIPPDGLSDDGQDAEPGVPYGPYIISNYTRANPDQSSTMLFVLSVHNPYNTMLMSATFRPRISETTPFRPGTGPVGKKFPPPGPPAGPFRPGTGPVGRKFPPPTA